MPNYKESAIVGTSWTRASSVVIDNTYNTTPSITFMEEEVFSVGSNFITKPKGSLPLLRQQLVDPLETFPLLDPATDQPIGEVSHGQIYAMIYSLYQHLAKARDVDKASSYMPPIGPVVAPTPVP